MVSCGDARDGFPFLSAASLFRGFLTKCADSLCQGRDWLSNEHPSLWFGCLNFYLFFSTGDPCNLGDIRYYCNDQFDRHDSINNNEKIGYLQHPVGLLLICPSL